VPWTFRALPFPWRLIATRFSPSQPHPQHRHSLLGLKLVGSLRGKTSSTRWTDELRKHQPFRRGDRANRRGYPGELGRPLEPPPPAPTLQSHRTHGYTRRSPWPLRFYIFFRWSNHAWHWFRAPSPRFLRRCQHSSNRARRLRSEPPDMDRAPYCRANHRRGMRVCCDVKDGHGCRCVYVAHLLSIFVFDCANFFARRTLDSPNLHRRDLGARVVSL